MNDEQTKTPAAPMVKLNSKEPIFSLVHQTETRTITEYIQGSSKKADLGKGKALEAAKEKAARVRAVVTVFGPQVAAYEPPKPAEPHAVGFNFGDAS